MVAGLVGSSLAETYFPGSQSKPKKPCLWSKNYQYHEYTIFDHLEHEGGDVYKARGHLAITMIIIITIIIITMINIMINITMINTMINITTTNLRWRCLHSKRPSRP